MSLFHKVYTDFSNLTINENGAKLKKSTQNICVDAFNRLVRGINTDSISYYMVNIMAESNIKDDKGMLIDMFVMMFHKRNCRGGEGEKKIMYHMLIEINKTYPETINKLLPLVPFYGYFKDYFEIWEIICKEDCSDQDRIKYYGSLMTGIMNCILDQMHKDSSSGNEISLLAKWLPRQGNHYDQSCFWFDSNSNEPDKRINGTLYLASLYYKQQAFINNRPNTWVLMKYRKIVSDLTKKLNVPEILMCANKYSEIAFEKVASKALKNYLKAFLNEKIKGHVNKDLFETGNRYPTNEDRVECRSNLKEFIKNDGLEKINGGQVDPHEIMYKLLHSKSELEKEILRGQWDRKKDDVIKHVKTMMLESGKNPDDFKGIGNCIPMIDVSGSMEGIQESGVEPMSVAIALGLMTSELSTPPYRDLAMSFTDNPHIFSFLPGQTPDYKCYILKRDEMGYSTKFDLAIKEILNLCIEKSVPVSEIPNLIVFTDGQFDEMNKSDEISYLKRNHTEKSWKTCHEELLKMWAEAGYDRIPNIIYWNLRSNTPGFQTSADHPGVQMLQGFSPSLLKFVLYGEEPGDNFVDVEIEKDNVKSVIKMKTSKVTPYDTFRKAMDQDMYIPVRNIVVESLDLIS
jgi:hypothetical protein